jgi:GNAT superfamily N-acetyltransferase
MDMLVKLYDLPDDAAVLAVAEAGGTLIRRPMAYEKEKVLGFVDETFGQTARGWRSECDVAFAHSPISCYIGVAQNRIIAFACYNVTGKGMFGPVGVAEESRTQGIGRAVLLRCLTAMRDDGYAYAVVGHVGSAAFFERSVGAIAISGSSPGFYPPNLT